MLKKTVTYINYFGDEVQDDCWFHFSTTDLTELEMSEGGKISDRIQNALDTEDPLVILKMFQEILLKAYGQPTEDGKRFIKSKELSDEFANSLAYETLFWEFADGKEDAEKFINALLPKQLLNKLS